MTKTSNKNLHKAKSSKNDEFYTQYHDIEKEMQAYLDYDTNVFKDKVILLPCDDPDWSNFTKYFVQNFERFNIKKLISTSYTKDDKTKGKIFTISKNDDISKIDINNLEWDYLVGDGDFRSEEITDIAKQADMIITNPPFSLFREFLAWIVELDKEFSIIGNKNAITYKEVFPLIKDNLIWLGSMPMGNGILFNIPKYMLDEFIKDKKQGSAYRIVDGEVMASAPCMWFTNIKHDRRNGTLQLMSMEDNLKYNKKVIKNKETKNTIYKKYDNYDAIEVGYTNAIPSDYDGAMGVPISFLDKYCPEQFEILGCSDNGAIEDRYKLSHFNIHNVPHVGGINIYKRIFIRHKR